MSLLAFNKTAAPLALAAGNPIRTLPASVATGTRGPAFDITSELSGLMPADYALLQVQVAAGQVEFDWVTVPLYVTPGLIANTPNATLEDAVFYYDPVGGDDNNPGSIGQQVKTLSKALSLLPPTYGGNCGIVSAAGTNTEAILLNFALPKPVGPRSTDFFIIGAALTNEQGNRTCTANDATKLIYTDNTLAMAVNQYFGYTLTCVSGANAGQNRNIISNDATSLTVNVPWTNAPAINDVFSIGQPTTINILNGVTMLGWGPVLAMRNLTWNIPNIPGVSTWALGFGIKMAMESVWFIMNTRTVNLVHNCGTINGGTTVTPNGVFSALRLADGYFQGGNFSINDRSQCSASNNPVFKNVFVQILDKASYAPQTTFALNTSIEVIDSQYAHEVSRRTGPP